MLVSKSLFFWLKKRLKVCQTFKKHLGIQHHMNRPKIVNSKTASKFWNNQKVTRLLFLISLWCSVQQNRKCTWQYYIKSNSLYRNRAGTHFYGTENEIWAGFVPVLKKKWGADYDQILRGVFFIFSGAKKSFNIFLNIVASSLKSCIR